jgi:hypothetical protein
MDTKPAPCFFDMMSEIWQRRDEVIASSRLSSAKAGMLGFAYGGSRDLSLGELLNRWQAGELVQPCPTCASDAFVYYYAAGLSGGGWGGLCFSCESSGGVRGSLLNELLRFLRPEPDDVVLPAPSAEITVKDVWRTLQNDVKWLAIRERRDRVVARYDPVRQVLRDASEVALGSWDGESFVSTDGVVLVERQGPVLRLAGSGGVLFDAFERDTLGGQRCHLKTGETYLPVRYRELHLEIVDADGHRVVSAEGPVPHDLLVAIAEGVVPTRNANGEEVHHGA